jgi:metal-responsive CopG/Arc/MetJ family transcriptional regulator
MPSKGNPLLSVRLEPELDALLPKERGERSRIVKEALRAYLCPPAPQDEMTLIKNQLAALQAAIANISK